MKSVPGAWLNDEATGRWLALPATLDALSAVGVDVPPSRVVVTRDAHALVTAFVACEPTPFDSASPKGRTMNTALYREMMERYGVAPTLYHAAYRAANNVAKIAVWDAVVVTMVRLDKSILEDPRQADGGWWTPWRCARSPRTPRTS